jgi:uncharacterized membrane protein YuzA (DUF378 family)
MKTLMTIILTLALAFGLTCFEAWIGMLLFNWVAGLFGCAFTLTFWQALGICALLSFVSSFFKINSKKN